MSIRNFFIFKGLVITFSFSEAPNVRQTKFWHNYSCPNQLSNFKFNNPIARTTVSLTKLLTADYKIYAFCKQTSLSMRSNGYL